MRSPPTPRRKEQLRIARERYVAQSKANYQGQFWRSGMAPGGSAASASTGWSEIVKMRRAK